MDYIEAVRHLKSDKKHVHQVIHKAMLLLSVIEMYESGIMKKNEIKYDESYKKAFQNVWKRCQPGNLICPFDPFLAFWYMQSEPFWHVIPIRGKEEILTYMSDINVRPSEKKINECVRYAELDDDFYFLITMKSGRTSLKQTILNNYTSLSVNMVLKLSETVDDVLDHSSVIINEQEKNSIATKKCFSANSISNKTQEQFDQLNEEIKITFNLEYFKFLKRHKLERDIFRELFPSVYSLYDCIVNNPIKKNNIPPSFVFTYECFLSDLKISLICEDDSLELIDKINDALYTIKGQEPQSFQFDNTITGNTVNDNESIVQPALVSSSSTTAGNQSLSKSVESRKGKSWTEHEDELLRTYFQKSFTIEDIAANMGRTENAIKYRLVYLGLLEDIPITATTALPPHTKTISKPLPDEKHTLDYFVENNAFSCSIFNSKGNRVFVTDGMFKSFRGRLYRLNYKSMCFTVKRMIRNEDHWQKGEKLIVADNKSDLFRIISSDNYINEIDDIIEYSVANESTIRIKGVWFNASGYKLNRQT